MAVTPKRGWRIPGLGSPENVPLDIGNLGRDIEVELAKGTDIIRVANASGYPTNPVVGQYVDDAALRGLLRWNGEKWVRITTDTGWVTCLAGNGSVQGTAKVKRVGNRVEAKLLSLTFTGGWPNSPVTAFTLPSADFAPGDDHRMNLGAAMQATAGSLILSVSKGATAVFIGANGGAGSSAAIWNGPIWSASSVDGVLD